MSNEKEIRWIQLSDLHMFASTDIECQKEALYRQFSNTTDFIIVTGDLHQYGTSYDMTINFLEEAVEKFGITEEDVVIVPGNHDVNTLDKLTEAIQNIDKNIENDPDVYINELKKLYMRFKKYNNFLFKFYGDFAKNYNLLENHMHYWKNKLAILCINTALVSDENHFKPQIVDIYGLQKLDTQGLPCIAIMHHDYYSISDSHKPYIKNKFRELKVSATLSGHKHRFSKDVIDLGDKETIPNFCCGKTLSSSGDLWSDIGIIEYRWRQDEVMVIPYTWDKDKNAFVPTIKFEDSDNSVVSEEGIIKFNNRFSLKKNSDNRLGALECKVMEKNENNDLDSFYKNVQEKYLDGILKSIGDNQDKFNKAIEIMKEIVTYNGDKIIFDKIVESIVACNEKVVLSINGLQGTGKSTFLSLLYYKIKKYYQKDNIFPILIDLHTLDMHNKRDAKKVLTNDLNAVDSLIKRNNKKNFILFFDGADEYARKTTELEKIISDYVIKNNSSNFAFCIGSSEYLPNGICSDLQTFSQNAIYKLKAHRVRKDRNINLILKNLIDIYNFSVQTIDIKTIKKAINVYTINEIDYRTLLIVLRVFDANIRDKHDYQLGGYFYDYYLKKMENDEKKLYKYAKATYEYIVSRRQNALRSLEHTKIIYNNEITVDFLLAYYFVYSIKKGGEDLSYILKADYVFIASVNKFIKDLILNRYKSDQIDIVEKLIQAFDESSMSMKSQISYILGRIQENNAKERAKNFLIEKWDFLYDELFKEDELVLRKTNVKSELVLFRTISVSLVWLGYDKKQEQFLRCLLLNEKLNQINRGFHLEYYEDKAYKNGKSPTYSDNEDISVNKTMDYLIDNINKIFSKYNKSNKSIYLDIITLFSIYQYRMDNKEIKEKYKCKLIDLADKILKSPKIQSKTIINYVTGVKDLLVCNPYNSIIKELYMLKSTKREGWIKREVDTPESIADHLYGCYMLGIFFLPNNACQCIDYNIPDIDNYLEYSKETILRMLLLHDLAEARTGDIITLEKGREDMENEKSFFDYYEYICSFPHIYGLGNRKNDWDEFIENSTINAKIANDIDKIEPLVQAYIYIKSGKNIEINEWKEYAKRNVRTSLGKQFLQFVIDKLIV